MKNTKVTPGNWELIEVPVGKYHHTSKCVIHSGNTEIATTPTGKMNPDGYPVVLANARMMSASKELYVALYDVISNFTCKAIADGSRDDVENYCNTTNQAIVIKNALDALGKAEGELV